MVMAILPGLCVNVFAATYWIDSQAGGWGTGAELAPFSSLETALKLAGGGNTFIFKPGDYPDPHIVINRE